VTAEQTGRDGFQGLVFDVAGVRFGNRAAAATILTTAYPLPARLQPLLRCPRPVVRRLLSLRGLDSRCIVTASPRFADRTTR
jgi:anti-anti-sigma regulatory factor